LTWLLEVLASGDGTGRAVLLVQVMTPSDGPLRMRHDGVENGDRMMLFLI